MNENNTNGFKIKTEVFEGPLDVLLSLIEKRKLLINDVSLAQVADDYISYIETSNESLRNRTNFLVVASTLLLIKSKSLLPNMLVTEEENQSISDLETRLKAYKRIKEVSRHISQKYGHNTMYLSNPSRNQRPVGFFPPKDLKPDTMLIPLRGKIKELKQYFNHKIEAKVETVISLKEMIGTVFDRVQKSISTSFNKLNNNVSGKNTKEIKMHVIVSFLAILELIKQDQIEAKQQESFKDISLESKSISTPKYGSQ